MHSTTYIYYKYIIVKNVNDLLCLQLSVKQFAAEIYNNTIETTDCFSHACAKISTRIFVYMHACAKIFRRICKFLHACSKPSDVFFCTSQGYIYLTRISCGVFTLSSILTQLLVSPNPELVFRISENRKT